MGNGRFALESVPQSPVERMTEWQGRGEAIVLGVVAGILILGEGLYLISNKVALPFASIALPVAGALGAVAGLSVLFLALFYRTYGDARPYIGPLLILISVGDLWFGGGFWVGAVLGAVSGVLVIVLPVYPRTGDPWTQPD